jgi:hypothetical protein
MFLNFPEPCFGTAGPQIGGNWMRANRFLRYGEVGSFFSDSRNSRNSTSVLKLASCGVRLSAIANPSRKHDRAPAMSPRMASRFPIVLRLSAF